MGVQELTLLAQNLPIGSKVGAQESVIMGFHYIQLTNEPIGYDKIKHGYQLFSRNLSIARFHW